LGSVSPVSVAKRYFCRYLAAELRARVAVAESPQSTDQGHPALSRRPTPSPADGQIKLDVLVTDDSGRPVAGLEQKDFALLDNKNPRPLLSFRAVDGVVGAGPGEPPVEVILLVDVTNTSLRVVG
jgi:hypothetical protein